MFHEMKYVYAVYQERSFSKAARRLYISQPSLSGMIKKAEARVGAPLFDRAASPIGVTAAGQAYIRAAEQLMEVEAAYRQYLSDAEACLTGTLSLGGTTLFTSYMLPPLISAFSAAYPDVEVRIREAHSTLLERALREGELDFVMENCAFDPAVYETCPYLAERLALAAPVALPVNERAARYRLTAAQLVAEEPREAVPLDWFRDAPFLLLKEGNDTRLRADRLCAAAGFRPRARLLLDQQITAYNLAAYGLGAAFVSDTLVRSVPADERLCFYRLAGEDARRQIGLVYRRGRPVTPPMRAFLGLVGGRRD